MNNYILTADATSYGKKKIYAKKGERVKEISDRENVVIVEDKNGNRFPALKIYLKIITISENGI